MKKFRKLAALALAATMAMTALTGCGGSSETTADTEVSADAMTVGFIYIGSKNDGGYTQAQNPIHHLLQH